MDISSYFNLEFSEHLDVARNTQNTLNKLIASLIEACANSVRSGGKILLFGNGGSAGDAQHIATELTIRYIKDRAAIPAIALTTDSSTLTAAGNDLGFEKVFARQLEALARPGDIAIAISTSGRSANILSALRTARTLGLVTAAFGGKNGGDLVGLADHLLIVPSNTTARIQEMHILLGHILCGGLEATLCLTE